MGTSEHDPIATDRRAWNSGRKVGAKRALKPRQVWAIRFFLDQHRRMVSVRSGTPARGPITGAGQLKVSFKV